MTPDAIARLLDRAKAGILDAGEQYELAVEFEFYRGAALRAEAAIHDMSKRLEEAGV